MFCVKCGKQLADGEACTCQQQTQFNQPQYNNQPQFNASPQFTQQPPKQNSSDSIFKFNKLTLVKIITLGLAGVTFLSHLFFNWYRYSAIIVSGGFGPYGGPSLYGVSAPLGEVSGMFSFARLLLILNVFVFLAYIAWELIDIKKFVPALGNLKFDLGKLLSLIFYGLMATALFFGLIGTFTAEEGYGVSVGIGFGWIFTFLNAGAGIVNFFMPDLLKKILKQQ